MDRYRLRHRLLPTMMLIASSALIALSLLPDSYYSLFGAAVAPANTTSGQWSSVGALTTNATSVQWGVTSEITKPHRYSLLFTSVVLLSGSVILWRGRRREKDGL